MAKVKVSGGCQVSPSFWRLYSLWQCRPARFFLCGLWVPKLSFLFLLYVCLFMCVHQGTTLAVLPRVPSILFYVGCVYKYIHGHICTRCTCVRRPENHSGYFPLLLSTSFFETRSSQNLELADSAAARKPQGSSYLCLLEL